VIAANVHILILNCNEEMERNMADTVDDIKIATVHHSSVANLCSSEYIPPEI